MKYATDDVRIKEIRELAPPAHLIHEFPCGEVASATVHRCRSACHAILHGEDDRMMVIVGPCSIHDPKAAREYAERLAKVRHRLLPELEIIMRVYFEKPRTTVGWKGLINDPDLDGSCRINHGLRIARELHALVAHRLDGLHHRPRIFGQFFMYGVQLQCNRNVNHLNFRGYRLTVEGWLTPQK